MPKQYKIDAVAEIESKLESNAGVFVVAYNGLTVLQAQELRKQLRECGAQMKVYKNNLVRIALENKEQPNLDEDPRWSARLRVLRGGACQRRQGAQGVRQEVQGRSRDQGRYL